MTPATATTADDRPANIFPNHYQQLLASGIDAATMKAAGIYSEANADKLAAILNRKATFVLKSKLAPAIVFPFVSADGRNGYARIKPDTPRRDKSSGKLVKYESPADHPNEIYLPPGVAAVLATADAELLITEGEKKALCASQHGFPCIGLVGVYGWKSKRQEGLLPALEAIAWQGRQTRIVFDSDIADKPEVQEAESRLAKLLCDRGAVVKVVRLPHGPPDASDKPTKMGLDDFLVAHGPGALRKLLDEADEPTPLEGVAMLRSAKELDPGSAAGNILDSMVADGVHTFRFWRGTFWRWHSGAYRELAAAEARGAVIRWLNKSYLQLTSNITNNVMDQLKAQALLSYSIEPPAWLESLGTVWPADETLATRSKLVHLPSMIGGAPDFTRPATPRFFTTSALDFDFAVDAPRPDAWLAFLDQLFRADPQSIDTLQEWFGLCLTPDTRQQKILMLIGPRRSGKGTIARVLRGLVGKENVAGPTLAGLSTNFGLWPLLGKSVAIISDARLSGRTDGAIVVERLLSISGEDALTIDRKNLEPTTCKLDVRLTILSNELPRLSDSSGALAGRMILLRLRESFYGKEDHALSDKLLGELPGILLWAIKGWHRLRQRGRFVEPDSSRELAGELADLASPIAAFIRERCEVGPGHRVAVDDLYAEWKSWCEENGRREPGLVATFGRDLMAAIPDIGRARPRDGDHRYRAYEGIGLAAG